MKRRQFLRLGAIATVTGGLGQAMASAPAGASTSTAMLADSLLRVHADRESASIIGGAFLRRLPSRPNIEQVVQSLIHSLDIPGERALQASPSKLRHHLKGKTSKEFDLGQTEDVQGWVLGKTEAWLCALASLRARSESL